MSYTFRPAIREQVGLLIGLIGPSGSGKTYTAMELATGICGQDKFAVIDTEARRSLHYADQYNFDFCELKAPFNPKAYMEALRAADEQNYKVIVVDSCSHEWAGTGGVLEMQEEELQRMAGDDWKKREACKMRSWVKPKMEHKKMIQGLLQIRATLILCFRAEEKIAMEKDDKNKTVIVPKGWQPICSKELPYELTVSFLLDPEKPGYFKPLKLQEQHKAFFSLDKPIGKESGRLIAQWAAGGDKQSNPLSEAGEPEKQESTVPDPASVTPSVFEHLFDKWNAAEKDEKVSVWKDINAAFKMGEITEEQFNEFTRIKDKWKKGQK